MKRKLILAVVLVAAVGLIGCNKQIDNDDALSNDIIDATEAENSEEISDGNEDKEAEIKVSSIDFSSIDVSFNEDAETALPVTLTVVSEENNKISEIQDWFIENQLYLPMLGESWKNMITFSENAPTVKEEMLLFGNVFYDDNYIYDWTSGGLNIYDRNSGQLLHAISYQTEQWYLMGNCAYLRDGILYIGHTYNGYAMPNTCYLLAYDIENEKVLWRSEDQTYNTMNFIVKDDVIICGYGFTDEKDYLYQIDMNTGKVISKTELKKMPDLLVEKDGQLYVHTYSYDYVFDMGVEHGN